MDKYNPDVLSKYKDLPKERPDKYTPTGIIWKKITEGGQVPDPANDPNTETLTFRLEEEVQKRTKEKKFVRRRNHAHLPALQEDPPETQAQDFSSLKKAVITHNDKLQHEKETYNKFLEDIKEII
jgi:hypothetical protein